MPSTLGSRVNHRRTRDDQSYMHTYTNMGLRSALSPNSGLPCADDIPVGDLQESQEAGGQSDEPRISQDAAKFDKPAAQPPCLKQQTAQHEPGFLQRLVAKQESHAVAWTDSESGAELGGDSKKGYANGSIQPMHLKATQQQDDSGAPTAPAEDQQANNVQSRKTFQSSKDSQDKQAQASRPSARSVGSQDSDRPRRGALPKRPLSAASQGSTGSRKRKAEPSSAMVSGVLSNMFDRIPYHHRLHLERLFTPAF